MASWAVAPRPATALQTPQRQTLGSPALASTGKATSTPASAATTDSPSNWRHPRIDEINQRRAATVFDETNLMTVIYNSVAFVLLYLARNASGMPFKQLRRLVLSFYSSESAGLLAVLAYAVLAFNIVRSLLPLFRKPDTMADIPLTPGQRKLLGLPRLATPANPNAVYTTPPRYARTPSVSSSVASIATATRSSAGAGNNNDPSFSHSFTSSPVSGSPLFPRARNAAAGSPGGSPFSPGSPFQNVRRTSFGSPAAAAAGGAGGVPSLFSESALSSLPGTPSPTGKRLSMGLNNKWLYEKGRRTSSGTRIY